VSGSDGWGVDRVVSASYRLCDHTADVAVEATGPDLSATFAAVADGFATAACDPEEVSPDDRFAVSVRAESREALLFDYLDESIYERDVRGVLPVGNEARVTGPVLDDEWIGDASARGVPLDRIAPREVKAVTYSQMTVEERVGGWYAYVVSDS
jgi:SHS2 domain-containing protein